jgi:ergothioneine biosynthesis protein EgtB
MGMQRRSCRRKTPLPARRHWCHNASSMATDFSTLNNIPVDSPEMRGAGRELLSLALMDARNHSLYLLAQFEKLLGETLTVEPSAEIDPLLWSIGHLGWFQEYWIARNLQRSQGSHPSAPANAATIRLASIEPHADRWWNPSLALPANRWSMDLPSAQATRAYLLDTLEGTLELLARTAEDDDALYFYRLSLFHEDRHGEALITAAQTLGLSLDLPLPLPSAAREPVLMPATRWMLGSDAAGFAFDNERAAHVHEVPEFEIDAQPVNWAQFVEFVDDGGYDRVELWQPQGWKWLTEKALHEGRRGPRYVEQIGVASGAVMQSRFGRASRMSGSQSAMHLSWWEADAWARWAGRRLPSEVEWEIAAHQAARRGFRWGDVWEWTSNTFRPYPGFVADPWRSYSEPFFGSHKVMRGASFATRARMKHPKFRHFAAPSRDDLFVGFRTCAS